MTDAPLSYKVYHNKKIFQKIEIEAALGHQYLLPMLCRAGVVKGAGAEVRRGCRDAEAGRTE